MLDALHSSAYANTQKVRLGVKPGTFPSGIRSPATKESLNRMVHQTKIALRTSGHRDMHDITSDVEAAVRESGVTTGTVHVFNIGSTGVIGVIEFEDGLKRDLPELLDKLIPPSRQYGHEQAWHDGNGHSHLQASTLGPDLTLPIGEGEVLRGAWQQIFHLECDIKPRERTIVVTVTGE